MNYYLFLDESGDHGLRNIDPKFPVFVLCGVLISDEDYNEINQHFKNLKYRFWGNEDIVLHSRDIRRCENHFEILFDKNMKFDFYQHLNSIITHFNYTIFSSVIQKERYVHKYGQQYFDVYDISLSFIYERVIYYLDQRGGCEEVHVCIEKRGKKENDKLLSHMSNLYYNGTQYVTFDRFQSKLFKPYFQSKKDNINGLQLSDLLAYPIAKHVINPTNTNSSFDLFKNKFYSRNGSNYGLKIFP
ncbi:DUF3800 domain-containing protein [Membranihabitans marinus]|uniref:DUF3800 domain-containing protein n=1 Tax=Membranihabitans marinus TaxID=1227546 RepID=UPI001F396B51|nr:DUF3800 domain-containing protein [Membranihabitans marinus]